MLGKVVLDKLIKQKIIVKCEKCNEEFEGYTEKQANTILDNHMTKHRNEERKSKEKSGDKK